LGADGTPRILSALGKFIAGDEVVDDYRGGTAGNLLVNVARDTGRPSQAFHSSPDGVGLSRTAAVVTIEASDVSYPEAG
jgi:hypothetical protein